ncbi:unnamed protein product [Urochloa humidicola]
MSVLAGLALVWKFPFLEPLREQLHVLASRFVRRLVGFADPYLTVTVAEHDGGDGMRRGEAYEQATAYLGGGGGDRDRFVLSLGDDDEVADEFRGATVWWSTAPAPTKPPHHDDDDYAGGGRAYRLVFHRRHCDLVVGSYLGCHTAP